MKILAIESSCDETAAAVVEDGRKILSNIVDSQVETHACTAVWCPRSHPAATWRRSCA